MNGLFSNDRPADHLDPAAAASAKTPVPQVVAVYQTNHAAHVARDALLGAGVAASVIHVIDRADPARSVNPAEARRQTLWSIIGSLFWPAEDPSVYHLAADPDHALVILKPDRQTDVRRAIQILRASRPFYVFPMVDEEGAAVHT